MSFICGLSSKMDIVERPNGTKYECLLFDLDDTLYALSSGLNMACRKNIEEYMLQILNIEESEVPRMCLDLYKEHGTTMAGLKALGYEFDDDEFHAYVHGRLPYDSLKPDPTLRNLLLSMPQRKIMFFDDSVRNIASAKVAGLHTVIVGSSVLVPGADYALSSIHNIKEAIPGIWESEVEQIEQIVQSTAVETVVLA